MSSWLHETVCVVAWETITLSLTLVLSPDLIQHVYHFQYNTMVLKVICTGIGFGSGIKTSLTPEKVTIIHANKHMLCMYAKHTSISQHLQIKILFKGQEPSNVRFLTYILLLSIFCLKGCPKLSIFCLKGCPKPKVYQYTCNQRCLVPRLHPAFHCLQFTKAKPFVCL